MLKFGLWIVFFIIVLSCGELAARAASGQTPTPNGLNDFSEIRLPSGQRQACWHGICPGVTTMEQATALMNLLPTLRVSDDNTRPGKYACWDTDKLEMMICMQGNQLVDSISLGIYPFNYDHNGKRLDDVARIKTGDLLLLWGTPTAISSPFCGISGVGFAGGVLTNMVWHYYYGTGDWRRWELTPTFEQTQEVTIYIAADPASQDPGLPWTGFISTNEFMCGE